MARVSVGIKVDVQIREAFKEAVRKKGLSTCFVMEALMVAWVEGSKVATAAKVDGCPTITINQNFQRVVKRERRKSGVTEFMPEANCYVNPPGAWIYRKPDSKSDMNPETGHHTSCKCNSCVPYVSPRQLERDRAVKRALRLL